VPRGGSEGYAFAIGGADSVAAEAFVDLLYFPGRGEMGMI
jgi:hypothetical protein